MSEECHVSCAGNRLQVQLLLQPRSQAVSIYMQQCSTHIAPCKCNCSCTLDPKLHTLYLSICSSAAHRLHHGSGILILQSSKLHTLSMYLYAVSTLSNKLCLLVNMQRGSNSVVSHARHRKQIALLCNLFQCPG